MARRPTVILHNAVSLDGWLDGFEIDLGLYYEIAGSLGADAILAGSNTILEAFAGAVDPAPAGDEASAPPGEDSRPLLAVVDSRGQIEHWDELRRQPFWREVLALCGSATPAEYLSRLERQGIAVLRAGERRVDLTEALAQLWKQRGARVVRVDGGGRLNAALLRAGLVDRVSLLVHPVIAGPTRVHPLVESDEADPVPRVSFGSPKVTPVRDGIVWLDFPALREAPG